MELRETERLTLAEFQTRIRDLALSRPEWWQRHSDREEIESMFAGCETFADTINAIGVLDPPGKELLPGMSDKVIDLRTRR